jgi:hypothetical protein
VSLRDGSRKVSSDSAGELSGLSDPQKFRKFSKFGKFGISPLTRTADSQ